MTDSALHSPYHDDEIDLRELFGVLWAGKVWIVLITAIFAVSSVFYALSLPNLYKASTVLAPAKSDQGGLSGSLAQLGGLASLAGVTIGASESSESQVAQEIMKSWSFIEDFISKNDIAVKVFAANGWSKKSNDVLIDDTLFDRQRSLWLLEAEDSGKLGPPNSWQLFKRFSEISSVSEDKKTGFVTVSMEYYSPEIAKNWLDMYVVAINKHMQDRQVGKVTNNIAYLEEQIKKTSITEMREVFYTIIEEQIKNKMVAEASPEYTFLTISPSMLPEQKSQPKRALICILGTLLGGMLSVIWILVRYYWRSPN
ncbi:MAG: LPS O-antigen length regulator [Porticoccaceae bacterium]|nr:LPS O-antigen length regulator [Porticoccaceae bacterium]